MTQQLKPRPGAAGVRGRVVRRVAAGLVTLFLTAVTAAAPASAAPASATPAAPASATPAAPASATPASAVAAAEPGRDEIYDQLGLDRLAADYVVLVDVSGSMLQKGRYSSVRSALLPFLRSLSPQDYVAVFTFGDKAEAAYLGRPTDPEGIVGKLPDKPRDGVRTDIGAALDRGLTELERPDAADVGSVVMFTDGKHEPPKGSPYPKASGAPWDKLRDRAGKLDKKRELAAYSLPLASDESGTGQLSKVVPSTTELRPESVQDLDSYLGRAADRARARKAGLLVGQDAGKGVTAAWRPEGALDLGGARPAEGSLTLTARTKRVPLTVTGLGATLDGQPLTVTGLPDRVTLKPGQSRTFDVRLSGEPDAGFPPVRRTWEGEAPLIVSGKVSSPWAAVLDDVTFKVPEQVRGPGDAVRLRAEVGSPVVLPLLIGVPLVVLLAVVLLWVRRNRVSLKGELVLSGALGGGPAERVALRGRSISFAPSLLGGAGRVHGSRYRAPDGTRGTALHISYSPDGTAARSADAVCRPGDEVVINGVTFAYESTPLGTGPLPGGPGRPGGAGGPGGPGLQGDPGGWGPGGRGMGDRGSDGPWPAAPGFPAAPPGQDGPSGPYPIPAQPPAQPPARPDVDPPWPAVPPRRSPGDQS